MTRATRFNEGEVVLIFTNNESDPVSGSAGVIEAVCPLPVNLYGENYRVFSARLNESTYAKAEELRKR